MVFMLPLTPIFGTLNNIIVNLWCPRVNSRRFRGGRHQYSFQIMPWGELDCLQSHGIEKG